MRRKSLKQKKGQFIIIAVLFIATMIISIGALLSSTLTYYKYEPWEEYITIIDGIKLNSNHLVELSLSNYTLGDFTDADILKTNLDKWKTDLPQMYPGYGVNLNYEFINGNGIFYDVYEASDVHNASASISANVKFSLDITSLGLTGYTFNTNPSLNLTILKPYPPENEFMNVLVIRDDGSPLFDLKEENFQIINRTIISLTNYYDKQNTFVYSIMCNSPITTPVNIGVCDQRGIKLMVDLN
jgi:hypothetical protein